ncbi:hypothetical protein H9M94_01095 [Mycoplasma sp. Pen4]|uniref:hypothetical protein n=1 Tax=Mycoplasma sp. Pen4 TaxID=640330 RepID=UPI00165414C2|nr:hypothetical protein [Mycoplasma sp. Pen4]QNM93759.1 hypothetical protein H9M94_00580 [Mycoplasma sp. Pen4]QNM93855.1 hypothetical protein H9M94_01095 [Mycoplasma sp. Pen4]
MKKQVKKDALNHYLQSMQWPGYDDFINSHDIKYSFDSECKLINKVNSDVDEWVKSLTAQQIYQLLDTYCKEDLYLAKYHLTIIIKNEIVKIAKQLEKEKEINKWNLFKPNEFDDFRNEIKRLKKEIKDE